MFKYYLGRVEFTISFFITDAVLAATLKDLFEDGIIDRKSYDEIPPPVKLFLTEKGKSVVPISCRASVSGQTFFIKKTAKTP